ncbi:ER membrane protein complex subunit 4 [Golovinomyces cichoracearum]|uniref:ER membrane protein complex subunit 4 n=1 Tax=Golovinomyces cichoracearum TaxID=62708 RepID=A0A420ISG1_9PEZI|nr:ER membrane protein complex subunit 4 [Golovinomyces cichoracearum]
MEVLKTPSSSVSRWLKDLNFPPAMNQLTSTEIPDPPNFMVTMSKQKRQSSSKNLARPPTTAEMDVLKLKKAWEVALAPVKQLPMTAFMMYMSGNTMQIFSIMMVTMAFKTPIMGLLSTTQAFERFESDGIKSQLVIVKGIYVLMQILALALGVWKVDRMGLLPTTRSDWLAWEAARDPLEVVFPAF